MKYEIGCLINCVLFYFFRFKERFKMINKMYGLAKQSYFMLEIGGAENQIQKI
jgi:hypothetical protein